MVKGAQAEGLKAKPLELDELLEELELEDELLLDELELEELLEELELDEELLLDELELDELLEELEEELLLDELELDELPELVLPEFPLLPQAVRLKEAMAQARRARRWVAKSMVNFL